MWRGNLGKVRKELKRGRKVTDVLSVPWMKEHLLTQSNSFPLLHCAALAGFTNVLEFLVSELVKTGETTLLNAAIDTVLYFTSLYFAFLCFPLLSFALLHFTLLYFTLLYFTLLLFYFTLL